MKKLEEPLLLQYFPTRKTASKKEWIKMWHICAQGDVHGK